MDENPFQTFAEWYRLAEQKGVPEPEAMTLATVTRQGRPAARVVLCRGYGEDGFVFYTNLGSRKALELQATPHAELVFYWSSIGLQVRIAGRVEPLGGDEVDRYWATRPRLSQVGAWASRQSERLGSRAELYARVAHFTALHLGRAVPRPPFWGGFRLRPDHFEFWQRGEGRLHDREEHELTTSGWVKRLLFP